MSPARQLSSRPGEAPAERVDVPPSAVARRSSRARWRDPRLWLGVLLVLGSVLVGARLMAAADQTVPVWQVEREVQSGLPISAGDLRTTSVHFEDEAAIDGYLLADVPLPADARVTRDLGVGELLTRSALTTAQDELPPQLPLGVAEAGLPGGLGVGDQVDVWAVAPPDSGRKPTKVLGGVSVEALGDGGTGGDRQVLVTLPDDADVGAVLDALNGAAVVLVRVGA